MKKVTLGLVVGFGLLAASGILGAAAIILKEPKLVPWVILVWVMGAFSTSWTFFELDRLKKGKAC